MAEENQKKKKHRLVWRIFKWIGLGLLALLLLAAIIFQAPWKAITLLAIILAACTILPKPARKWFWLSAAAIVVAFIIWVFLPEADEGWRPYTFDEELAALEAKYAIPDEENAAMIYNELFDTLDVDSNQPEFFIKLKPSSKDEPWLTKDHPETAEWLKGHQKTIGTLIEISRIEKCKFSIPVGPASLDLSMKRLPKIRRSTFLLVSAANNDMAEGRIDAALEKCLCVIQMANHLYQQPVMISFLVGFAIEHMALERLNRFVIEGQPSGKQLRLIANSIKGPKNNWGPDWQKILDFEKLYAKNMLCGMVYEADSEGKTRLTRRSFASTIGQSPKQLPTGTYSRRKCAKLGVMFVWLYVPSAPEKIGEIVDASYAKYYAMTEPGFDWDKEPVEFRPSWKVNYLSGVKLIANLPEQAYYRVHEIYLRNLELRRGSRLLTAIKQYNIEHGSWPRSLDEIKPEAPAEAFIDPVSGNEFDYENHGERFSLYGETINIWPK
ncbi:MAG TPA: hypothetical protein VMW72_21095 [Sedimentisphaerales bacterium]|nr:hypothetical protein [Sedimentisphaerales bacterium]